MLLSLQFYYVEEGKNIKAVFLHESGPKESVLKSGEAFVVPQAYMHGLINDSCRPAKVMAILNHYDAGVNFVSSNLSLMPT